MAPRYRLPEILVTIFTLGLWAYLSLWVGAFSSRNGLWDLGAAGWLIILMLPAALLFYYTHTALSQQPVNRARLSLAGLILLGMIALGVIGSFASAKENKAHQLGLCQSHARQLALALLMYADDWQALPPADSWAEAIPNYAKEPAVYKCPADKSPGGVSYAMNAELSGKNLKEIANPSDTPLIYEIPRSGNNPQGNPEDGSSGGRHGEKYVIAFADSHVATDYSDDAFKMGDKP